MAVQIFATWQRVMPYYAYPGAMRSSRGFAACADETSTTAAVVSSTGHRPCIILYYYTKIIDHSCKEKALFFS